MAYRKKEAADFSKNVLAQYGLLDDEDDDEVDAAVAEDEEQKKGDGEGGEDALEDEVAAVTRKRPRLTPELLISKFDAFLGPTFRGLSDVQQPGHWCAKLVRLYESWADSVFPQLSLEVFLKRCEKQSSNLAIKNALFELSRKRARIEEAEEEAREGAPETGMPEMQLEAEMGGKEAEKVQQDEQPVPAELQQEDEDDELVLIFD